MALYLSRAFGLAFAFGMPEAKIEEAFAFALGATAEDPLEEAELELQSSDEEELADAESSPCPEICGTSLRAV